MTTSPFLTQLNFSFWKSDIWVCCFGVNGSGLDSSIVTTSWGSGKFIMGIGKSVSVLLISCFCLFGAGCRQENPQPPDRQEGAVVSRTSNGNKAEEPLRFYNWEDYTGAQTLERFKEATGIDVHLETFEDEESVISGLQSGAISADLIVVSQSLAQEMLRAKLLQPVDYQKIPNSKYFKEQYIAPADEQGKRYWAPYLWGTTGMVINTNHVTGDYRTWSVLWDPRYKGKIAMLNNGFEVTAAASKMLGYRVNPTVEQLEEISAKLVAQRKLVKGYYSAAALMDMVRDETIWAAQIYNGDGLVVADESDHIRFINPREGTALWIDVFVIPRNAKNPEKAHAYIDFVHTPEILGSIATEYWFASTNEAAEQFMPAEVLQAEEVYPPEDILRKSEFFQQMGSGESVRKRVQIWSMLMSE